ncbi:MAG: aldo/keto reductase [Oscillatoriales cyanobacterium SM2_2_1]|nr:aldo/keto reductase [Oscillatoriales cyanobacterium SM2_2_1]
MERVRLGKTDIETVPLGVGTWAWGDSLYWTYGKDYDSSQIKSAYDAAIAAGITLFDTAEVYGWGESERLIGQFIKPGDRPNLHLATKYMPLPWRIQPQVVHDAITHSLERLRLKTIDLYQVHQPCAFLMSQKTLLTALAEEVKQGRIRAIGVSNYSAKQMREAHDILAAHRVPLAANQVLYSILDRQIETNGIRDTARELGITILAYSPLAQGLLTGKFSLTRTPKGARQWIPRYGADGIAQIQPLLRVMRQVADQYQRTLSQIALNWLICQGQGAVIPIPGAKNAAQAEDNAGALGWTLDRVDVAAIAREARACQPKS